MDKNYKLSEIISPVREYAFHILDENAHINVYTNISLLYRIEKNIKHIILTDQIEDIDLDAIFLASYIMLLNHVKNPLTEPDFNKLVPMFDDVVCDITTIFKLDEELVKKSKTIAIQCLPTNKAILPEAQILSDATAMDFAGDQGRDRFKLMYEQMILHDLEISKSSWYDIIIPLIKDHEFYTNYGKTELMPLVEKLTKRLKKEKKEIDANRDLVLKKELNISDVEIKNLKKGLTKIKGRDDRGIQTLFRTTSKNHYTLNRMVDGKASIMITVNSILLSLALGGVLGKFDEGYPNNIPTMVFSVSNVISIIFAILSITPNRTQGNFTEDEIRSKKGNLLYYGNFFKMHYRDFEWAFLQILQDKDYLYTSMIRDYYYQAQVLNKKSATIRVSLFTFLFGIALTIISKIIVELS